MTRIEVAPACGRSALIGVVVSPLAKVVTLVSVLNVTPPCSVALPFDAGSMHGSKLVGVHGQHGPASGSGGGASTGASASGASGSGPSAGRASAGGASALGPSPRGPSPAGASASPPSPATGS